MTPNTVKVAAVQMESRPLQREHNLAKASQLAEAAAKQGAQLILFPELMPGGYLLTEEIWKTAEPFDGPSLQWLRKTAQCHSVYVGTTFLEREGNDFYNSFVLITPQGELAGRVRKSPPASVEAYFYRAGNDLHFFDTDLGRIGVTICYEGLLYEHLNTLHQANVDIVLQPASAPTPSVQFPISQRDADNFDTLIANGPQHYAKALGVPVIMANKAGKIETAMPGGLPELSSYFPGRSCIVDSNGTIKQQLNNETDALIVHTVKLDKRRKILKAPTCYKKRWAMNVPWYAFIWRLTQWQGERHYQRNEKRKLFNVRQSV